MDMDHMDNLPNEATTGTTEVPLSPKEPPTQLHLPKTETQTQETNSPSSPPTAVMDNPKHKLASNQEGEAADTGNAEAATAVDEDKFWEETEALLEQTEQLLTQSEQALGSSDEAIDSNSNLNSNSKPTPTPTPPMPKPTPTPTPTPESESESESESKVDTASMDAEEQTSPSSGSSSTAMMKTLNLDDSNMGMMSNGSTTKLFPLTALRAIPKGYAFICDRSLAPVNELFKQDGDCLCAKVNLSVPNARVLEACSKFLKKLWTSPVKAKACIHGIPKFAHPAPQQRTTTGIQSWLVAIGAASPSSSLTLSLSHAARQQKQQRVVCMVGVEVQSKDRLLIIALPPELRQKYARFQEILDGLELDAALDARKKLEASTLPGVSDSISCLKETRVLSKDYAADLDAAHSYSAEVELKEYLMELDKIAEMEEWKLARMMSILRVSYMNAGISFPTLKRAPALESFPLKTSNLEDIAEKAQGEETTVEEADRVIKLRLQARWKNQIQSRKDRKQKHFNARIATCTENCSQLICRLRDSAVAFTSKETLEFIRKMEFSGDLHAVLLARVAAIHKGKPGTLYITYHHVCFHSAIFAYTTRVILNLATYTIMHRVQTLSVLNTLRLTSSGRDSDTDNAPVDFLIPSGTDFARFSEVIDQVLLQRKRHALTSGARSSSTRESKSIGEEASTKEAHKEKLEAPFERGNREEERAVEAMSASTMLQPDEFEF